MRKQVRKSLTKMLGTNEVCGNKYRRLEVLVYLISGILSQSSCRLNDLAKMNPKSIDQASKEKQLSRWLQSDYNNHESHYLPFIVPLLSSLAEAGELIFSIDGSSVGQGCMVLMLSVIYKKRAIPVVWHVVKAKKGHLPEQMHRDLLQELVPLIPEGCEVSILGDGEYDGCGWQADIGSLGWNYVLRTGSARIIETELGEEVKIATMAPAIGESFFMLYGVRFTQKKFGPVNLLIWHGKGYKDPIYLLTNLEFPPRIEQLYKKRFLIETFFSDQKSRGFNLQRSHLKHPQRIKKLIIAAALAYILCLFAGIKSLKSKFYQRIHRKDRCDLSLFTIGKRFIEYLVDIRQWRAFSLNLKYLQIYQPLTNNYKSVR